MRAIGQEITGLGLKWSAVKNFLPDWASEAVASPSGSAEVRSFLASHLGLDIANDGTLRMRVLPHAQFKTTKRTQIEEIASARAVVGTVARLVARATTPKWQPIERDAATFRQKVLGNHSWIDLANLVEACWSHGVPVVYLPDLPVTGKKMQGMVTFADGRPVILLTKKHEQPDWQLFTLAHEIGHLARNHLPTVEGEAVIDEVVAASGADDEVALLSRDDREAEANKYATELLTGGITFHLNQLEPAAQLARTCVETGKSRKISPGHLVLNAVNHTTVRGQRPFSLANAALKCVDQQTHQKSTREITHAALRHHVELSRLRDESVDYLQAMGVC